LDFLVNEEFFGPGGQEIRFKPRNIIKETDNVIAGDHVHIVDDMLAGAVDTASTQAITKLQFFKIAEADGVLPHQVKQRIVEQAAAFRVSRPMAVRLSRSSANPPVHSLS
jgi:hypothetical protein